MIFLLLYWTTAFGRLVHQACSRKSWKTKEWPMSVWLVAREQAKALVLHWPARHAKQVWLLSPTDLFRIKECMGQNQVAGFFYRMRSKGSRFTLGVWGWGCVRSTSRLRPQPFATVRVRAVCFWRAPRFAWQAWHYLWPSNMFRSCFITCRKLFASRHFQKMRCVFRGRRSTVVTSMIILRGRRRASNVSCCVFFANRSVRAASSGDKSANSVAGVLWQKIAVGLARNIVFDVVELWGSWENS